MKSRKSVLVIGLLTLCLPLTAQDIYKMEAFSSSDLNGTARFVGMGGAMSALGADISTIGTNPAGIGMFRKGEISLSAGFNTQPDAAEFYDINKTRASFDQMGFVYSAKIDQSSRINFAFNYHKSRNFKNYIGVNGFGTDGLSQSLQMMDLCWVGNRWLDLSERADADLTTNLAYAGYQTQMILPSYDERGNVVDYLPCEADYYNYQRVQWGGIQDYDFNVSMGWNDQIYAGITLGVKNVNYHAYTDYAEFLPDEYGQHHEYYTLNEEEITGTGIDFKMGLILRPIEESPFRIGLSFSTPTFYNLTTGAYLYMNSPFQQELSNGQIVNFSEYTVPVSGYEYNIRTPWKVNVSMATTLGNFLALDAEYEYSNYGTCKVSYGGYDEWGGYSDWWSVDNDKALNNEASHYLKGVHTFRVGAEARLSNKFYLRAGYNYQSAPMTNDAFLNLFTDSPSYYYSNNTDYVNLGKVNRYTCGLGYRGKHLYADFAYQYKEQQGDLYTFHVPDVDNVTNRLSAAKVDLNRHAALFTLGYRF